MENDAILEVLAAREVLAASKPAPPPVGRQVTAADLQALLTRMESAAEHCSAASESRAVLVEAAGWLKGMATRITELQQLQAQQARRIILPGE